MSVTGYFEHILSIWDSLPKRTPTNVRDMKEILRQFQNAIWSNEIEKEKLNYLQKRFRQIYKEVYK